MDLFEYQARDIFEGVSVADGVPVEEGVFEGVPDFDGVPVTDDVPVTDGVLVADEVIVCIADTDANEGLRLPDGVKLSVAFDEGVAVTVVVAVGHALIDPK